MHGIYKIKVVRASDDTELLTYHACTHPVNGETLILDTGRKVPVISVYHVLEGQQNGAQHYTGFAHVKLVVAM